MDTFYGSLFNPPPEEHSLRTTAADSYHHYHLPSLPQHDPNLPSIPSDEAAELEWLSEFIHDTTSFPDFSSSNTASFLAHNNSNSSCELRDDISKSAISNGEGGVRKCSHCASEKTPQWRTGPLGPKTLCNACGVRFKSGRLVPEYRPAASPTFVLTQHSNSHRKVMELRRQKQL